MLGWTEVQVSQINTENDIDKMLKTLAENIMRKDLKWQEDVRQKAEIDQLMRAKHGSADKHSHPKASSPGEPGWSIEKTAELLNQTKGHLSEDLQLAKDLEEDPELEKIERKSFAKRTVKQKKKRHDIDQIPKQELKGKHNVLLADPPRDYDTKTTALRGRAFLWIECQLG